MEGELLTLASTAATALVSAMVSDSWAQVRDRVAHFFGRGDARDAVEDELRLSRDELAVASAQGDQGTAADVEAVWRTRLRRMLQSDPGAAEELRTLLADLAPAAASPADGVRNSISGGVQHGPVVQGRDFSRLTFHVAEGDTAEDSANST